MHAWKLCPAFALTFSLILAGCGSSDEPAPPPPTPPSVELPETPEPTPPTTDMPPTETPEEPTAPAPEEPTPEEPAPEEPAAEEPTPSEPMPEPAPEEPTPDETTTPVPGESPAEPADDESAADESAVQLGDPDLTAGIPGAGPLTVEQIAAWLDDPANHVPLNVSLPLGLSAGALQIKGLDQNPLTRAKIELGRQLYFDGRLSADGTISCASCHHPEHGYARETQFGVGIDGQMGGRNSPVSYNRILSDLQFWDGRADSLEAQAVGPIANPIEMGNTHENCVATLAGIEGYRLQFEKLFGAVTIEAVGQAIASFERAIVTGPSPFDYNEQLRAFDGVDLETLEEDDPELYAAWQAASEAAAAHPMSEGALRGRELFFSNRVGCTACHVGPNLSDEKYHNLGVGMSAPSPDLGRFVISGVEADRGAFKTPTIRNVALTAPYMHDGSQKTLEEVVAWYSQGGHPNPNLSEKIKKLDLTDQEKQDLVAFMQACTGDFPPVQMERLPE